MITFIDTLSATCQRMNDKKDCEPIVICNQTKYNEEKKEAISMARTANVFARVEPELKEQAESVFRSGQFYFDACYNPSKTAFLKNAEKKGCKILNGLGMSSSRGLLRSNYGPDRRLHWM